MKITYNTDRFLVTGKTHEICEDYAIVGECNGYPYLIVSDGCSSSAKNAEDKAKILGIDPGITSTDFGSRILCAVTKKLMPKLINIRKQFDNKESYDFIRQAILRSAIPVAEMINARESLYATLILGIVDPEKNVMYVYMYGDGSIITKDKDNVFIMSDEFRGNAPHYLIYTENDEKQKEYTSIFGDTPRKIKVDSTIPLILESTDEYPLRNECQEIALDLFDLVALSTDGIGSFIDNNREVISSLTIAEKLTNIAGTKGKYLQRVANFFFKDAAKNKIIHTDDLAMASVYIRREEDVSTE